MNFFKALRDPIWQSVGVLITVLIFFISASTPTLQPSELAIVHMSNLKFNEYWLPSKRVKLTLQGTSHEIDKATVDYFTLINRGDRPILPSDFLNSLSLTAGGKTNEIFLVDACAIPNKQNKSEGNSTVQSYVATAWQSNNGIWSASPVLLNPNDMICILVISEPKDNTAGDTLHFLWDARIVNSKIKVYANQTEYGSTFKKQISDYLYVNIHLENMGIFWFVLLQCALFGVTLKLSHTSNFSSQFQKYFTLKTIFAVLISSASAEVLVDVFYNQREPIHPISWPILAAHCFFLIFLTIRSLSLKQKTVEIIEITD